MNEAESETLVLVYPKVGPRHSDVKWTPTEVGVTWGNSPPQGKCLLDPKESEVSLLHSSATRRPFLAWPGRMKAHELSLGPLAMAL